MRFNAVKGVICISNPPKYVRYSITPVISFSYLCLQKVYILLDHCLIHELCFMNGQSNKSNPCQLCDTSQSKDSWTENPGMFTLLIYQSFGNVPISIYQVYYFQNIRRWERLQIRIIVILIQSTSTRIHMIVLITNIHIKYTEFLRLEDRRKKLADKK